MIKEKEIPKVDHFESLSSEELKKEFLKRNITTEKQIEAFLKYHERYINEVIEKKELFYFTNFVTEKGEKYLVMKQDMFDKAHEVGGIEAVQMWIEECLNEVNKGNKDGKVEFCVVRMVISAMTLDAQNKELHKILGVSSMDEITIDVISDHLSEIKDSNKDFIRRKQGIKTMLLFEDYSIGLVNELIGDNIEEDFVIDKNFSEVFFRKNDEKRISLLNFNT